MMKTLSAIALCVVLGACSVAHTYNEPQTPVQVNMEMFTKKSKFIELVEFVKSNANKPASRELQMKASTLLQEAGLKRECSGSKCWLQHNKTKITMDREFITMEFSPKEIQKIDVNYPEIAADVLYKE